MSETTSKPLQPKDVVKADDPSTWELAWEKGVTPWDFGHSQPSLQEAITSSGVKFPPTGRALVPGCGAGYDLQYISVTLGFDTLGLDIADTAIKKANELIQKTKSTNPNITASISNQDFFTFDPPESERFDLIYDHTFFCAIPPSMRTDWASKMAKLIKPGGYLIAIVFPIRPFDETGPPYYIIPEHYEELLGKNFVKVLDKIPEVSSPSHEGMERLMIWRRL